MPRQPPKPCNMDPAPPVTPEDGRPSICDLLEKHSDDVNAVREIVSKDNPLYNADFHDDLWILRFVLDYDKPKAAAKAAVNTMKYRAEHGLEELENFDWIDFGLPGSTDVPKIFSTFKERIEEDTTFISLPNGDRGLIIYMRIAGLDMTRMINETTEEAIVKALRITLEFYFRVLDEITRRTGRLTKMVRLMDMSGMSASGLNRKYTKIEGNCASDADNYYPQQLANIFVFNAPGWIAGVWKVVKYVFPARVRQKVDIMSAQSEGSLSEKSRVFYFISASDLPTKYGGTSVIWPPQGCEGPPEGEQFCRKSPDALSSYDGLEV